MTQLTKNLFVNLTTLSLIVMLTFSSLLAQDLSEYMTLMVKHKKAFKMTQTEQGFQDLANNFERIANAETDKWHPLYYAGLCYINMTFVIDDKEKKDAYLEKAQTFIDRALEIYPDESELYVLQALLYQAGISIDPAGRGMQNSMKAGESLNIAKDYNPENPRVYYLLAMNVLHTPEAFGGGKEPACKYFATAVEKYRTYQAAHVLSPTWGGERNQNMYNQNCK